VGASPAAYLYNGQPGTSDAALYTASGSAVVFPNLVAVNATSGAVTLSLSVHRAVSGVTETICDTLSVPAHGAVSLLDDHELFLGGVELEPGDSLHGSAGAATSVTVTAF
jgi:hypothetical protein